MIFIKKLGGITAVNTFEPIDTTMNSTVADVKINSMDIESTTTTVTYAIKQPSEYKNDFYVNLRASDIKKSESIVMMHKNLTSH